MVVTVTGSDPLLTIWLFMWYISPENMLLIENPDFFFFLIYFWLHWVFIAACGLSVVAARGSYSSLRCAGLLIAVASLAAEHRL